MNELTRSIGQYCNYLYSLKVYDSERIPYLALTKEAYDRVFTKPIISSIIRDLNIRFIIFNPYSCTIEEWKH